MKHSVTTSQKPAVAGTFLRGFRSGAINSSLMLGIFSLAALAFGLAPLTLGAIGATVVTTGVFSGVMGARKAKATAENAVQPAPRNVVMVPTVSADIAQSPTMEIRNDWAERTGRGNSNTVQQILANGSLTDQNRAAAILAARENQSNTPSLG